MCEKRTKKKSGTLMPFIERGSLGDGLNNVGVHESLCPTKNYMWISSLVNKLLSDSKMFKTV